MDRLTPFRADEVFWTCDADRRDTARNRLHARVTIVPRVRVQPVLAALQRAGLVPMRIEAGGSAGSHHIIPFDGNPPRRTWFGPRIDAYALGGCGVLAVAAVALPFIVQSIARTAIDARIEAMRPQAALAEALRKLMVESATLPHTIAAARVQAGAPLHSIAMLTDVLPDDTHLTTLGLWQRKLTISGRSAAAARLIGAMAAHPLIHNPVFAAPVIRDPCGPGVVS
jgi:general secretion pathway protein L